MMTFAFGSGLAGVAGACLSQIGNVGPSLGQSHIVDCFMIVVLGGVGNLIGTVCASLGIGVTDQVLQQYSVLSSARFPFLQRSFCSCNGVRRACSPCAAGAWKRNRIDD